MAKAHLYINSKGYFVTRHSYSGSESFNDCARKYYLERVQGWSEREQRSSSFFGIALEKAITYYHQHKLDCDGAVAEFDRLWGAQADAAREERKEPKLKYNKTDVDWTRLSLNGRDLVRLYHIRYPNMPYIVNNPLDFQVETNFEVFPGTKLAGIEFTSYIDLVAQLKGSNAPLIIDMKTSGKDVPELTVLDPQLRSYAWVKSWSDVAFLWFRKMGRQISKGDTVTLLEAVAGHSAGDDLLVAATDDFGIWVTNDTEVLNQIDAQFVGKSKAVEAARQKFIEENAKLIKESSVTKQRVQFKQAYITQESAEDIGRKIKRDIIAIANATEKDFFPMESGVRYPHERCPNCPMRGICSGDSNLRDMLLVRKQLDEFDFGKESE